MAEVYMDRRMHNYFIGSKGEDGVVEAFLSSEHPGAIKYFRTRGEARRTKSTIPPAIRRDLVIGIYRVTSMQAERVR